MLHDALTVVLGIEGHRDLWHISHMSSDIKTYPPTYPVLQLIVAGSVNAAIERLCHSDTRLKGLIGAASTEVMSIEGGLISNIICDHLRGLK